MTNIWEREPALVERLTELWNKGFSCTQIAKALGNGITRNAVIGKVTRIGLAPHPGLGKLRQPRMTNGAIPYVPKPKPVPPPSAKDMLPLEMEGGAFITVENALRAHCRFPYGDSADGSFRYCGRKAEKGSFCLAHGAVCYQPLDKNKKTPEAA